MSEQSSLRSEATGPDRDAIESVVRDYIEGWYSGDVERMNRALHDDLVKRTPEGEESGGHIGAVSTLALVPQVVDNVTIPVIAAGGLGDGRGLAAALALGASGIQMGTRFICADECIAHDNYKQSIVRANERSTMVTGRSIGHPVRCIRNPMARDFEELEKRGASDEEIIASLEAAMDRLVEDWGSWEVAWGEMNRSQRPPLDEQGNPIFDDKAPSIATPGVPSWSGGSQIASARRRDGLKRRYKTAGNSYTAVVHFAGGGERTKSKSIHVFGASADPSSPHNMDQAKLLAAKQYKPAWLFLDDVKANAARSYHPGEQ